MNKNVNIIILLCVTVLSVGVAVRGQNPQVSQDEYNRAREEAARQRRLQIQAQQDREMRERYQRMRGGGVTVSRTTRSVVTQGPIVFPNDAETDRDRELLRISDEDIRLFSKIEGQRLIRIFDEQICLKADYDQKKENTCPNNRWNRGSSFSFRVGGYMPAGLADISLRDGELYSGGMAALGLMREIDDGESLFTSANVGVDPLKSLLAFKVPKTLNDYEETATKLAKDGVELKNGTVYNGNGIKLEESKIYILRSIAMKSKIFRRMIELINLPQDTRADVIIVFKAIRRNADQSWLIVWKELSLKKAPELPLY